MLQQVVCQTGSDPYLEYRETIQEILYRSFNKPDFPFQAKLFSVACLASEVDPVFYPQTESFELERLAEVVDKLYNHQFERFWLEGLQKQAVNLELPMSMLQSLLLGTFKGLGPELQGLIRIAWTEYVPEAGGDVFLSLTRDQDQTRVNCADMAKKYARRRDRLFALFAGEIEKYLENYCTHQVFAKDYTLEPSLFDYVQDLTFRVMLLKFLLVSQPECLEILERAEQDRSDDKARDFGQKLDAQIMRTFKVFSSGLAQDEQALDRLRQMANEQGMRDLAHISVLIQF
jgi:hypothetical protein